MADFLDKIEAYKREEIEAAKRLRPLATLEREARVAPPVRGFLGAIERRIDQGGYALIAEIKKASPSKGLIRADFDPPALARAYVAGGATCLSVLTDPRFQARPEHLGVARAATALPVLRKDFMYDPYQVFEARAWGADCILITLAIVDDDAAKDMEDAALSLGMDRRFVIHTPLMWRDKAATWILAEELGGAMLVELVREETHSCYRGDRTHRHDWGYGCGVCPACDLRRKGWECFLSARKCA